MRGFGLGQKVFSGPAEISSFTSRDFRRRSKHDLFWLVLSTGYFYIFFNEPLLFHIFFPWKFISI